MAGATPTQCETRRVARKPARLERAGALTPRDRIWQAIRALAACVERPDFSPAEVMALTALHVDTVCTYFRGLCNARPPYVELVARRPASRRRRECFRYILVRDVGVTAPGVSAAGEPTQIGESNQSMWLAMKALRAFTRAELAEAAQHGTRRRVSSQAAATYIKFLYRAGYLGIVAPSTPGKQARYRFVKNTGPRAPLVCRDKSVMDANTGEVFLRGAQ